MEISDISISKKKSLIIFVPHITKLLESKNSDEENNKNCSEKNNKLIEFKHSNSFQLFIYQPKEELYFRYKIYFDKFFRDNRIEKIYPNFFLYSNINIHDIWCKKKNIVYNYIKDINKNKNINKDKNVNKCRNSEDILTDMKTRDSLSLLKSKKRENFLNFSFSKKNYCNFLPSKKEMNNKPCQKPSSFPIETFLGINENHRKIGNEEYINLKENIFCSDNDSYKIINTKEHELLNHFFQKNYKINAINFRYRHKYATLIYYK